MTLLRIVLLALAVAVFAAIGWRLAETTDRPSRMAATAPDAGPVVSLPSPPMVAAPSAPASPATPASPKAPQPATPPTVPVIAPQTPAGTSGDAGPPASAPAMTDAQSRAAIDATLQTAPDLARVFAAIKAAFPAIAEHTLAVAAEATRTKGTAPSPDDFVAAAMRDVRVDAGVLAAHAGPEALGAIFDAKAATLNDLESADPRICADYLFGATSPEFNDFVVAHRALIARAALATIAAMADGRTRQISWDAPSSDDYARIEHGLAAKGLSPAEIGALLDGKSLDPQPSDMRLCDNMRAYLDVIRALPPESRNRVYGLAADLLARS